MRGSQEGSQGSAGGEARREVRGGQEARQRKPRGAKWEPGEARRSQAETVGARRS